MFGEMRRSATSTIALLMLFTAFALLALMQVLYGAQAYARIAKRMEEGSNLRASLSYVSNKLHAHDGVGPITIEQAAGLQVLCLWDEGEGTVSCVYFMDGVLKEQFLAVGTGFLPELGQEIARLSDFTFASEGEGAYTFTACSWEGTLKRVTVRARVWEGGAP